MVSENGKFVLIHHEPPGQSPSIVAVVFAAPKRKPFVVYDSQSPHIPRTQLEKLALEIDSGAPLLDAIARLGPAFRPSDVQETPEPLTAALVERIATQYLL